MSDEQNNNRKLTINKTEIGEVEVVIWYKRGKIKTF